MRERRQVIKMKSNYRNISNKVNFFKIKYFFIPFFLMYKYLGVRNNILCRRHEQKADQKLELFVSQWTLLYCTSQHIRTRVIYIHKYDNNKKVRLQNESSKDDHDYDDDEVVKGYMIYERTWKCSCAKALYVCMYIAICRERTDAKRDW